MEHRAGGELVVPDALSTDAVPKPLCQRCYSSLDGKSLEYIARREEAEGVDSAVRNTHAERVSAVMEVGAFYAGPSIQ